MQCVSDKIRILNEKIGGFDLILFLNTQPMTQDTFFFLSREKGIYKIKGWLF